MIRETSRLAAKEFDLIVVGGGIFGVCAAWDAALRGLSVALLERGDFGEATSANSYKFAHGGMRYLQQLDIPRLWESSHERSALIRVAPHLVYPLPILMPTYGHGSKGKELLRAGLSVYDVLTATRNRGIADPRRRIPSAHFLSRNEALSRFPHLSSAGLTGGVVFADGQIYNTPRLTLAHVRSAMERGSEALNYAEVVGFLRTGDRVHGVEVHDRLTDRRFSVRAKVVLNATGPWAAPLLENSLDLHLGQKRPVFSRDIYFVTRRALSPDLGLACQAATRDAHAVIDRGARHLFLLPWRGFTLVGVWHGVYHGPVDDIRVSLEEVEALAAEANGAYPGLQLTADEVCMVNTGLILFGEGQQDAARHDFGKRSVLLDHARDHGIEGLMTLVGVRATVARGMAAKAVEQVFGKLGRTAPACRTSITPVFGGAVRDFEALVAEIARRVPGRPPAVARALAHNYGSGYAEVLELAEATPALGEPFHGATVLRAEAVHAVRREMAASLADVVLRRTDLGTACRPSREALADCADLVGRELEWDRARADAEVAEAEAFFGDRGAIRRYGSGTAGTQGGNPARSSRTL